VPQVTRKELGMVEELLRFEQAMAEKFALYAREAGESATRKLCEQLADRSREHFHALIEALEGESLEGESQD